MKAAMDFLDLCEQTARFARREKELRALHRGVAADEAARRRAIDEQLEEVVIEKRIALLKALDWHGQDVS